MTLAIDFDGVIHAYSKGWQDGTIYDPPIPGALNGLRTLMDQHAVFIHTSREPEQVMPWLEGYGFDVTIDERCGTCPNGVPAICADCKGSGLLTFWNHRGQLLVTNRKLPAVAYLDDRAIRFESWSQALVSIGGVAVSPQSPRLLDATPSVEERVAPEMAVVVPAAVLADLVKVAAHVSVGKSFAFIGQGRPYPDATARRALGALDDAGLLEQFRTP
jgi:hypothetical protein